ncbi:MAG: YraN family protein [Lachnospiraceae bacterium]|nr:YraN family protein [Lachnospiraceae bacterium]
MNKVEIGRSHEEYAALFLKDNGIDIIETNYRVKPGEVDLIGFDGDDLVFFEVKYRKTGDKGFAADSVNLRKQFKICRVSDVYMLTHNIGSDVQIRYDVIAMDGSKIDWIRNAFDYIPKRQ